jgi:predicted PurR-regulated permease PerM
MLGFLTFVCILFLFCSFIATIIPSLIAFAVWHSLTLSGFVGYCVTDSVLGNFVDPKLMGQSLDLSPLLVVLP